MKSIRAILTDIDGCVLEEFASLLLLYGLQSYCRRAREEKGAPLAFCTGRSTEAVDVISKITGAFFAGIPSIVDNGACCPGNAEKAVKSLVGKRGGYAASASCGEGVIEIFDHYKLL